MPKRRVTRQTDDTPAVESVRPRTTRLVKPAEGCTPASENVHLRWVRKAPRRMSEMKRRGYIPAGEDDVRGPHPGEQMTDGSITDGDLVLMKVSREYIEDVKKDRIAEAIARERVQDDRDRREGVQEMRQGSGTKFYSIP